MFGVKAYVMLAMILFIMGIAGVISRRNIFTQFMCVELMLNAGNLVFIAFGRFYQSMDGSIVAMMVMAVAAAEAALALAVVILLNRSKGSLDTNVFSELKG